MADPFIPTINIFGKQYLETERLVFETWIQALWAEEQDRMKNQQRLLDWYNKDREAILEYCAALARETFTSTATWQWPPLNFVTRTTKRLSLAYRQKPTRTLINLETGDPLAPDDEAHEIYADMMYLVDPDMKLKQADNFSTLLNTIHIEVVPRDEGRIDWEFRLGNSTIVLSDPMDYLSAAKLAYRWEPVDPDTLEPVKGWIFWTPDLHIFRATDGRSYGMSEKDGSNPYDGIIPIVTIRKLEQDDYWGVLGADLVDANQSSMVQLANAWEILLFQTHGQAFGTNITKNKAEVIKLGQKYPIFVNNVSKDMHEPSLKFIAPEGDVEGTFERIVRYIELVYSSYGLPRSSWSEDNDATSGISKFMDNIETLENRDDGIPMWTRIEQELFQVSKLVYNTNAEAWSKKPLPENVGIEVTFPSTAFPETPTEEASRWAIEIEGGLKSYADYQLATGDFTDRDAALEFAKQIAAENAAVMSSAAKESGADKFTVPPGDEGNEE